MDLKWAFDVIGMTLEDIFAVYVEGCIGLVVVVERLGMKRRREEVAYILVPQALTNVSWRRLRKDDPWTYEIGTEIVAALATNDCYRQYTEYGQEMFHESGPWAWILPDNGQLRATKPR